MHACMHACIYVHVGVCMQLCMQLCMRGVAWRGVAWRVVLPWRGEAPWRGVSLRTYFDKFVSQHLSGAGSSPADSVGRDLNLQKLHYQYLTTIVAVVLVVR